MSQNSRQKATMSVKTDFFKLLNNSSFGIDCHSNIDNCILEPLYDNIGKIPYIKKFATIFNDDTFRHFFFSRAYERGNYSSFSGKHVCYKSG